MELHDNAINIDYEEKEVSLNLTVEFNQIDEIIRILQQIKTIENLKKIRLENSERTDSTE